MNSATTYQDTSKRDDQRITKFHGVNFVDANLIYSPDDHCSCQSHCQRVVNDLDTANEACTPLTGPSSSSFRFVSDQACDPDNC
jgi:hypothetical protein